VATSARRIRIDGILRPRSGGGQCDVSLAGRCWDGDQRGNCGLDQPFGRTRLMLPVVIQDYAPFAVITGAFNREARVRSALHPGSGRSRSVHQVDRRERRIATAERPGLLAFLNKCEGGRSPLLKRRRSPR